RLWTWDSGLGTRLVDIEKLVRIEKDVAEIDEAGFRGDADGRLRQRGTAERLHAAANFLEESGVGLEGPVSGHEVPRLVPLRQEQLFPGQRRPRDPELI